VLVGQLSQVDGQSSATPHELEIQLSLFLREALFKDTPEHHHHSVVARAPWVHSDRLQFLDVEGLLSTGSDLNLVPLHQVEDRQVAQDSLNAASQLCDLLLVLVLTGFDHEIDELLSVLLGHGHLVTIFADGSLCTMRKDSDEVLLAVNCVEVFLAQSPALLLNVLEGQGRQGVDNVQV